MREQQADKPQKTEPVTLERLNTMPPEAFVALCAGVYEHSPWVAEKAVAYRPFANHADMVARFAALVDAAPIEQKHALICAHPELGYKAGSTPALTGASRKEQKTAGLDALSQEEWQCFQQLNAAYRRRFDMPFIICVRETGRKAILDAMIRRLEHTPEAEFAESLKQIHAIAYWRLKDITRT